MARKSRQLHISGGTLELYGFPGDPRFTDDELAVLAEHDLTKLVLHRQHLLTRVPPVRPTIESLQLSEMSIASLAGIEKLFALHTLELGWLPQIDVARELARIRELPDLSKLSLWLNLATLPALPSLVELNVSLDAAKMDLPAVIETIAACTSLRRLSIAFSDPIALPDALTPLVHVRELRLSNVTSVPPSLFALRELEGLTLAGKQLTTLPPELGQLGRLRYLDVEATRLKVVPSTIGSLASLRSLKLPCRKPPKQLPAALFALKLDAVTGWYELHDRFQIAKVETGPSGGRLWIADEKDLLNDFGDPDSLELLLPGSTNEWPQLDGLVHVSRVDLSVGNLADALRRLAPRPHLKSLSIRDDHERLPEELGLLVGLTQLALGNWHTPGEAPAVLAELPASLDRLVNLESLAIGPSRLAALPDAIASLAQLRELKLRSSPLTALPAAIGRLGKLQSLTLLQLPALQALPEELLACTALAELSCRATGLTADALGFLGRHPSLRTLDVSFSLAGLAAFLDRFADSGLVALTLHDIDDYQHGCKALPASIGGLTKLQQLDVGRTRIVAVPPELAACTALRRVMFPFLPADQKAALKRCLPKGRWKYGERSGDHWYERTDIDPDR